MPMIPLIRVAVLRPVLKTLVRLGAKVDRYLDRVALSSSLLEHPEAFMPLRQATELLHAAAVGETLPSIGLMAGVNASLEDLGIYGRHVRRSPTLGGAVNCVIENSSGWTSGERWRVERRDGDARLYHWFTESLGPGMEQAEQYAFGVVLNLVRQVAGTEWGPREASWQSPPSAAIIDCPFLRGTQFAFSQPAMSMTIPVVFMQRPMPAATISRAVPLDMEQWLHEPPPSDYASCMRKVIAAVAPRDGHPRIDHAAIALGLSVRTLQRRLGHNGLRFEHLVQHMLYDTAADLLANTDTKIVGIALDMGYSDHAHFTRAFRKWAGVSPLEYRRRHGVTTLPGPTHLTA
jgi:AraC-like DNA-binding protein